MDQFFSCVVIRAEMQTCAFELQSSILSLWFVEALSVFYYCNAKINIENNSHYFLPESAYLIP